TRESPPPEVPPRPPPTGAPRFLEGGSSFMPASAALPSINEPHPNPGVFRGPANYSPNPQTVFPPNLYRHPFAGPPLSAAYPARYPNIGPTPSPSPSTPSFG